VAGGPLVPLTHSLPAAYSGDGYLVTLNAEGGTGAHVCVPQALHVGSIHLTRACVLTGTAPVVATKSITGPFTFKMTDHSSPPKTVDFGPLNFTTLGKDALLPVLNFDGGDVFGFVAIGEHVAFSLCRPAPVQGRDCGGPFVHGQKNPIGGPSRTGPYLFRRAGGFFPPGLVLHSNGLVIGTVSSSANTNITYKPDVCVSDWAAPATRHNGLFVDGSCEAGEFTVEPRGTPVPPLGQGASPTPTPKPKPKPKPPHFDPTGTYRGTWTGTFTSFDNPDCQITLSGPVEVVVTKSGGEEDTYTERMSHASFEIDPVSCAPAYSNGPVPGEVDVEGSFVYGVDLDGNQGDFWANIGSEMDQRLKISEGGVLTGTWPGYLATTDESGVTVTAQRG
jgi:hypothetical protein